MAPNGKWKNYIMNEVEQLIDDQTTDNEKTGEGFQNFHILQRYIA